MLRITSLNYRYVEKFGFWDIYYRLDDMVYNRVYVRPYMIEGLDMEVPDAVASLLRAKLDCIPVRGVEKH